MAGELEFRTAETKEGGEVFSEAADEARVGKRGEVAGDSQWKAVLA